jgi:hypothetical protein
MIGQIDAYYIAAQIRLVRQADKRTILVLEGETDARVFDRLIDHNACDIEIGFGRKNVIEAIDLLEDEGFVGVIGVADADFDRLIGKQHNLENLCLTDCHDLDLTIFSSPALERYMAEHADPELMEAEYKSDFRSLRTAILVSSLELSFCRLVSERDGLRLYFKDLRHDQYIGLDLLVDVHLLTSEIIRRSTTRCTIDQLKRLINIETGANHDLYQVANGHDVAAILGIALRKLLGCRRVVHTWASEIEAGLRLAFDWEAATNTELFKSLRGWEANNNPYRIFRQQPA